MSTMYYTISVESITEHNAVSKTNITVKKFICQCYKLLFTEIFILSVRTCDGFTYLSITQPCFNCDADHGTYFLINAPNSPV